MNILPLWGISQPFSALSHLFGAAVFLCSSGSLLTRARGHAQVISFTIFAVSTIFLLSMSGTFHIFAPAESGARAVLQRLDHAAIFVLIAATFTPVHMILLKGLLRWGGLAVIWIAAITGLVLKTIFFHTFSETLGTLLYLALGWCGIVSVGFLWKAYGIRFVAPLIYGALAYSIGAIIDLLKFPVLIPGIIESHELFHVAVLGGLNCHWSFMVQITNGGRPVANELRVP